MLCPCVPCLRIEIAQRTVNSGVFLGGINHGESAEQVAGLDQAAEQADVAGARGIGCDHIAGEAACILCAVDRTDAPSGGGMLFAGIVALGIMTEVSASDSAVILTLPCVGVQTPNVTALIQSAVAAGAASLMAVVRGSVRSYRAAAGNA